MHGRNLKLIYMIFKWPEDIPQIFEKKRKNEGPNQQDATVQGPGCAV